MDSRGPIRFWHNNAYCRYADAVAVVRRAAVIMAVAVACVAGNVAHAGDARSEHRITSDASGGDREALRDRRLELLRAFAEQITQEREQRQATQPEYRRQPPPRPPSLAEQPR
jgi:hypothetical protein